MKNYPVVLTNMNRLTTCKNMVEKLFELNGSSDITIIDNASTYEPLLKWYDEVKNDVKIIRHQGNHGPWVFFTSNLWNTIDSDFYVYSDADLELNEEMPYNWQEIMLEYYNKHNGDLKIALSLRLDDIPDHYEFKDRVKAHQNVCWYPTEEENVYRAISDLQFCFDSKTKGHRYDSLRLAGKFMARHIPWYLDFNNIDKEERYYIEHINPGFDQAMYSFLHHSALKSKA